MARLLDLIFSSLGTIAQLILNGKFPSPFTLGKPFLTL